MYKRRKPRRIEASFLFMFWVDLPSLLETVLSFVFPNKTELKHPFVLRFKFWCCETELRKLHIPPTIL